MPKIQKLGWRHNVRTMTLEFAKAKGANKIFSFLWKLLTQRRCDIICTLRHLKDKKVFSTLGCQIYVTQKFLLRPKLSPTLLFKKSSSAVFWFFKVPKSTKKKTVFYINWEPVYQWIQKILNNQKFLIKLSFFAKRLTFWKKDEYVFKNCSPSWCVFWHKNKFHLKKHEDTICNFCLSPVFQLTSIYFTLGTGNLPWNIHTQSSITFPQVFNAAIPSSKWKSKNGGFKAIFSVSV